MKLSVCERQRKKESERERERDIGIEYGRERHR